MSPRRKATKSEPAESPSASFLGPDPVFEEDADVEEKEPEPTAEYTPVPKLEPPEPIRTRHREEEFNKCLILFSREQLKALAEHLKKHCAELSFEARKDFEQGPLGQVLKNLG